jgi:hypothetical protein
MRLSHALCFLVAVGGCNCDNRLTFVEKPPPADAGPVDAGHVDAGEPPVDAGPVWDAGVCGYGGTVTGRVCAPSQQEWVSGADVVVDATDCNGAAVHLATVTDANGYFTLGSIPPGTWTIVASSGAFSQSYAVTVTEAATTTIPLDQLCVQQAQVKIAVVTAGGDHIETLLTQLGFTFQTFAGDASHWSTVAEPFLSNVASLKAYDIVFVDCAAAKSSSGSTIDLGGSAPQIAIALHDYVQAGGSVYASDWAFLFPALSFPGNVTFALNGGGSVNSPFDTRKLMGYAPQLGISATVKSPLLAAALGQSTVKIDFPKGSGVSTLHWGLMQKVDPAVEVLIEAPSVKTCKSGDLTCANPASQNAQNVPLAVWLKTTPGAKGGNVVYTSFHNIGQATDDVERILKYIVLHL